MMSLQGKLPAGVAQLLSTAAEWRLLGLLFEYPSMEWRANLQALIPALASPQQCAMAEAALQQASEGLHLALFGPAGTVPVREVAHRPGVQLGYLMAELAACYQAFGYAPQSPEAADHLSVQLGFMAYLKLKQAYALLGNHTEAASLCAAAADDFRKEHLAVQAEPVLRMLQNCAPAFLVEAGQRILALTGPSPRSNNPLAPFARSAGEDDEAMGCGAPSPPDELTRLLPGQGP